MTPTEISHVTVETGHSRLSPRSEVGREALDSLATLSDVAELEVPGYPDYRIVVTNRHPLMFLVEPRNRPGRPLVTCALALTEVDAAIAWRRLTIAASRVGCQSPRVPWLGVSLGAAIVDHPDAAGWLGDLERCVAWALIGARS